MQGFMRGTPIDVHEGMLGHLGNGDDAPFAGGGLLALGEEGPQKVFVDADASPASLELVFALAGVLQGPLCARREREDQHDVESWVTHDTSAVDGRVLGVQSEDTLGAERPVLPEAASNDEVTAQVHDLVRAVSEVG